MSAASAAMGPVLASSRDAVIQRQREEIERSKMMAEDILSRVVGQ